MNLPSTDIKTNKHLNVMNVPSLVSVSLDIHLIEVFYIKFEGLKFEFSCTWLRCVIALSYAMCTDFRTLGFLPSIRRSLSTVSSMPM